MILLLAAALGALPAAAEDLTQYSAEYLRCAPLAADDLSRISCVLTELQKQNSMLEQAIEIRSRTLAVPRREAFVKQQHAWFLRRNRRCLGESKTGPGPIFAEELKCRLLETVRRKTEMERPIQVRPRNKASLAQ